MIAIIEYLMKYIKKGTTNECSKVAHLISMQNQIIVWNLNFKNSIYSSTETLNT